MTLHDFILSYKDENGTIKANLFDYYETYIKGLAPEYKRYSYYSSNLVLCYMKDHADVNPSMGYMRHKTLKGVHVCHCFGCGRTADVVRLHQILRKQYDGVSLDDRQACLELAGMFSIPVDDFEEIGEEDYEAQYLRDMRRIGWLKTQYTIRDFSNNVRALRDEEELDLVALNSECVKMIATAKKLYDI